MFAAIFFPTSPHPCSARAIVLPPRAISSYAPSLSSTSNMVPEQRHGARPHERDEVWVLGEPDGRDGCGRGRSETPRDAAARKTIDTEPLVDATLLRDRAVERNASNRFRPRSPDAARWCYRSPRARREARPLAWPSTFGVTGVVGVTEKEARAAFGDSFSRSREPSAVPSS